MCRFASGLFRPDTLEVAVADLNSHSRTQELLGLPAESDGSRLNGWREFHYAPAGEIECRVLAGDDHSAQECESALRARWPRFVDFLSWALEQEAVQSIGGYLDLGGLTSAAGLTLPQSIGGGIYLSATCRAELVGSARA